MIYEYDAHGITRTAVSLYKENKNKIGEIYKATMTIKNARPVLSLYDMGENELRIISGIISGYNGECPRGVLEILRDAGFEVKERFIYENATFSIEK